MSDEERAAALWAGKVREFSTAQGHIVVLIGPPPEEALILHHLQRGTVLVQTGKRLFRARVRRDGRVILDPVIKLWALDNRGVWLPEWGPAPGSG